MPKAYAFRVRSDIFALLEDARPEKSEGGSFDLFGEEYELIVADPPHYLSLDFVSKIAEVLKPKNVGVFLLYFSHKEVEWTNLFVHRLLQKKDWRGENGQEEGWREIWDVLVADERLVVAFGQRMEWHIRCFETLRAAIDERLQPYEKDMNRDSLVRVRDRYMRVV